MVTSNKTQTHQPKRNRAVYMRDYRKRQVMGVLERQRPGRKPVDLPTLTAWEFEWYKSFHLLRDGIQLPPDPVTVRLNRREAKAELEWWKKASIKDMLGGRNPGTPPPFLELPESERARARARWEAQSWTALKQFAEYEKESHIATLERQLQPRRIYALVERREIWDRLMRARTAADLKQVCEKWQELADVRASPFTCFADHVLTNATEFLRMKRNRRFPRSPYTDDSRLEYLARGMAGVMLGASPMTAIERLRNMNHAANGPLWSESEKLCKCWQCGLRQSRALYREIERSQFEEGETS